MVDFFCQQLGGFEPLRLIGFCSIAATILVYNSCEDAKKLFEDYGVPSTTKFRLSNFFVEHAIVIFEHAIVIFDHEHAIVIFKHAIVQLK